MSSRSVWNWAKVKPARNRWKLKLWGLMTSHRQRKSQRTETWRKPTFKGHIEDIIQNIWIEVEDQEKMKSLYITHS